jgi:hypothetical protein
VPPPLGDLHRIECWLLHHGLQLKNGSSGRRRTGMVCLARIRSLALRAACGRLSRAAFGARFLYERSAFLNSATEELKIGAPVRTCTSNLRFRKAACIFSYTSGAMKLIRHAGAAPAPAIWLCPARKRISNHARSADCIEAGASTPPCCCYTNGAL